MKIVNKIFLILAFALATLSGIGQTNYGIPVDSLCNKGTANNPIEGEVIVNKKYYKNFGVLFRDTCQPMNRISYCYFRKVMVCPNDFYYAAFLIDSAGVEKTEKALLTWLDTISKVTKKNFHNTRRKSFFQYVRCYGGFIDEAGEKYAIVQLLTKKEFARNGDYKYRFDLFAQRKTSRLRFLLVNIQSDSAFVHSFFL
jgi:hypothetical protein